MKASPTLKYSRLTILIIALGICIMRCMAKFMASSTKNRRGETPTTTILSCNPYIRPNTHTSLSIVITINSIYFLV